VRIMVSQNELRVKGLLKVRLGLMKGSDSYDSLSRSEKSSWLQEHIEEEENEVNDWALARMVVLEVKDAIGDRIQMFRRLDSDIRLHERMLTAQSESERLAPSEFSPTSDSEEVRL